MPSVTHPRTLAPAVLVPILLISVLGAVVGMQLLTTLGVTPNTSLIGALLAMVIGRLPLAPLRVFRSVHAQNLAQSAISAATFGAANSLLLPMGVPWVLGRPDLVLPMFVGVALAMLLDATLLYRMFDTPAFPATGAWPPGRAAAEAIRAGDEGGKRGALLGGSVALGMLGSWLHVPMAAFGTAFIGNAWALAMFGCGLLASGYGGRVAGVDLLALRIPHGMMIGAGLVALGQVVASMRGGSRGGNPGGAPNAVDGQETSRPHDGGVGRTMAFGFAGFVTIAAIIALAGGAWAELQPLQLAAFIVYAALAALVHEILVGLAAMHSGWFPAFAVALITLIVGMLLGFPPVPLALLAGFSVSTGPAFADMGYDLKAGFLLRDEGRDAAFERVGRREQFIAAMAAFLTAGVVVLLAWRGYFARDLVPPVARVYVATIQSGVEPGVARALLLWAIPGAVLQLAGGSARQLGVLLATGLLIANPAAGWAVLAGLVVRLAVPRLRPRTDPRALEAMAAGFIAGDALFAFGDAMVRQGGSASRGR
ncbi:MAG: OPT/YSL family transporter [Gemmatimonadaceae bacterium]|nr:OPT/YSL family transporter [Gemmatimonadaceae bacterium]